MPYRKVAGPRSIQFRTIVVRLTQSRFSKALRAAVCRSTSLCRYIRRAFGRVVEFQEPAGGYKDFSQLLGLLLQVFPEGHGDLFACVSTCYGGF